jgi:cytidyltransferase-like protein
MIIDINELGKLNLTGKVVGVTSGCYDLLHFYHLHYFERCKAECDFLIVGVDSDQLLSHFKSKPANIPEHHRARMVEALRCVDAVFTLRNLAQLELATRSAHKLFKNLPQLYGKPIVMDKRKCKLVVIPDIEEITSTSGIVEKIRKGTPAESTPRKRRTRTNKAGTAIIPA